MRKNKLLLVSLCALTLGVTACGEKPTKTEDVKTLFEVSVPDDRKFLEVGETIQITTQIYGYTSDVVAYSSSDESILTVDQNGLVTAVGDGDASIIVKAEAVEKKQTIPFTVVKNMEGNNRQLQEMIDSISGYDYSQGVHYTGSVSIDLGDLRIGTLIDAPLDITLPLDILVQTDEEGTNIRARFDLNGLIDLGFVGNLVPFDGLINKTVAELLYPDFADTLETSTDFGATIWKDTKYIDLYNLGNLDYYAAATRNFGTEEEPDYRPFAFGKSNFLTLISPFGNTLLDMASGNNSGDSAIPDVGVDMDLSSLLTRDGILEFGQILWGMMSNQVGEDYTTVSFPQSTLDMVNTAYGMLGIGGDKTLELMGMTVEGIHIPTEITGFVLDVENKAEGENKFSGLSLSIYGDGDTAAPKEEGAEDHPFFNFTINQPEMLTKDVFSEMKADIEGYEAALGDFEIGSTSLAGLTIADITNVKKLTKNALSMYEASKKYSVAETSKIKSEVDNIYAIYNNPDYVDDYRKDLLYPAMKLLDATKYGSSGIFTHTSLGDGQKGSFVKLSKDEKEVKSITYTSDKPNIIKVDENGVYEAINSIYTGSVLSGKKSMNSKANITASITYADGASENIKSSIQYTGDKAGFNPTKVTLVDNEKLDKETHTFAMKAGESFEFSSLIKLPDGATEETITYKTGTGTTINCKGTTIDKATGKLDVKLAEDKESGLASVIATCKYKLNGESVTDEVIIFVEVAK